MSKSSIKIKVGEETREIGRCVFQIGNAHPALPRVIIIAGMHGNEPSGLQAMLALEGMLLESAEQMAGGVIGLIGNFEALKQGKRYIDQDLNRMWGVANHTQPCAELIERMELEDALTEALSGEGPRYVLDLHTTSSDSEPFMTLAMSDDNRAYARLFAVPAVIGVEAHIKGTLLEQVSKLGHIGLAYEAGQHEAPESMYRHAEFVLQAIHHAGILSSLDDNSGEEGQQYDIIYRHGISPADAFKMRPGFKNFDPVRKGALLADDQYGKVKAPCSGLLFMPLYQAEGDDGFFIVK